MIFGVIAVTVFQSPVKIVSVQVNPFYVFYSRRLNVLKVLRGVHVNSMDECEEAKVETLGSMWSTALKVSMGNF